MSWFSRAAVLLLLVWGVPAGQAAGQAWTQERGAAFLKVSAQRSGATEQYRRDGSRAPYADGLQDTDAFLDRSVYTYAEIGLTNRLTLVGMIPYKRLTVRMPHPQASSGLPGTDRPQTRSGSGVEKVLLAVRGDLTEAVGLAPEGRHRMALNLGVRLPAGYARDAPLPIGAGQVDVEVMLHYGLSLWPAPMYAQGGAGLRARTGMFALSQEDASQSPRPSYGNEWLVHGEVGASLGPHVLLQGMLFGTISNEPPPEAFDPENPSPTHQRYLKTGLGITVSPVSRIGLSLQVFSTPWGANTVRSTDWFFGVETRL